MLEMPKDRLAGKARARQVASATLRGYTRPSRLVVNHEYEDRLRRALPEEKTALALVQSLRRKRIESGLVCTRIRLN